ncbi:MAG TPA: hypothetical protein VN947_03415 [Polyangia bacterium]|nr:hypothetical protein [Polyangia bacterium]
MAHPRLIAVGWLVVTALFARDGAADAPAAGLRVELPAPVTATATARFVVRRRGEGMGAAMGITTVSIGSERRRIEPGEEAELRIAADSRRLTRLTVGSTPLLVFVAPGAELWLVDDPCTSWRLDATWLDSNDVPPPDAYCAAESEPCRAGFADGSRPRLARDPICAGAPPGRENKRCVRLPLVRAQAGSAMTVDEGDDAPKKLDEHYQAVRWRSCAGTTVRAGRDRVALAIGPAERWTLHVGSDGRVGGTRDVSVRK